MATIFYTDELKSGYRKLEGAKVFARLLGNNILIKCTAHHKYGRLSGQELVGSVGIYDSKPTSTFCDYNSNDFAIEAVDGGWNPVFQQIKKRDGSIVLKGVFSVSDSLYVMAGHVWYVSDTIPSSFSLKRIFKYPSWKFPGQYEDSTKGEDPVDIMKYIK